MAQVKVGPVKLNRTTMNDILSGGQGMAGVLQADANRVMVAARDNTPWVTGELWKGWRTQTVIRNERRGVKRMVVQVVNDTPYSAVVERRRSILARALGASAGQTRKRR